MSWSFKLLRVMGVDLRVHALFGLLIAWQALSALARTGTLGGMLEGVGLVLALFGLIVLHELGHARMARRFGIRTEDITLLPIGGIARLARMPERPIEEILVAVAGPLVNVALAAVLLVVHLAARLPLVPASLDTLPMLTSLLYANVGLAVFNLIPAFPLDGGRILRALLSLGSDRARATRVAARIGQAAAFAIGVVGFFSSMMLVVLAAFIWIAAAAELASVDLEESLRGIPLELAMLKSCDPLLPDETLDAAAKLTVAHGHQDFPVVDREGRVLGVLTGARLIEALALAGPGARVADAMDPHVEVAGVGEPIESVLRSMEADPSKSIVVLGEGQVRGLVTHRTIAQLASFREALRFAAKHPAERAARPTLHAA